MPDGTDTPKDADTGIDTSSISSVDKEITKQGPPPIHPIKQIAQRFWYPGKKGSEQVMEAMAKQDEAATAKVRDELKGEAKGSKNQVLGLSEEAVAHNQPPEEAQWTESQRAQMKEYYRTHPLPSGSEKLQELIDKRKKAAEDEVFGLSKDTVDQNQPPATPDSGDQNLKRAVEDQANLKMPDFSLESPLPDITNASAEDIARWVSVPGRNLSELDPKIKKISEAFIEGFIRGAKEDGIKSLFPENSTNQVDFSGYNTTWTIEQQREFLEHLKSKNKANESGKSNKDDAYLKRAVEDQSNLSEMPNIEPKTPPETSTEAPPTPPNPTAPENPQK